MKKRRTTVASTRTSARLRAVIAVAALGGCGEILAIPERGVDPRVACVGGECACEAGYADCDGDAENGCEADLASAASCGACGVVCRHAACQAGACVCEPGFDDCDGDAANGCEADLASDTSCGACGRACVNAACAAGACECLPGFSDCDADDATGCEVDVLGDAESCGVCGHGCAGGACDGGQCQPVVVLDLDGPSIQGYDLDVDAGVLYVSACGLPTVPTSGGAPTFLLADSECPMNLVVAHGRVFWTDIDRVMSTPVDGQGPSIELATGQDIWTHIAVTGTHVYWWDAVYDLKRVPIDGGTIETVTTSLEGDLFTNGQLLAWFDGGSLVGLDLATDVVSTIWAGTSFPGYDTFRAMDDVAIYWENELALSRYDFASGMVSILADESVTAAVSDSTYLYYWYYGAGTVNRIAKDGSAPPSAIASGQSFETFSSAIVADDEAVYWLTETAVVKVAKGN